MSKIWAAVAVQCQAFLMKNDFLDSEWYGYVFLVKKHVINHIYLVSVGLGLQSGCYDNSPW